MSAAVETEIERTIRYACRHYGVSRQFVISVGLATFFNIKIKETL